MNQSIGMLVLAGAVMILILVARRIEVPYHILLVLGGTVLGFVPLLSNVELQPDLIFLLVLLPLFFESAWLNSWRDIRQHLRPVFLQAVGLVIFTTCIVAVVAHALIPQLLWGMAFVLGAVISPKDDVTTRAIAERIGLPRRVTTILGGETLVNDAAGVTLYRLAAAAVASGTFSIIQGSIQFVVTSVGSMLLGLVIGWLSMQAIRRIQEDRLVSNAFLLLTPFVANLLGESLHGSGILTVVAAGMYMSWHSSKFLSSSARRQAAALWDLLTFLLNGFVFILIGLELRQMLPKLSVYTKYDNAHRCRHYCNGYSDTCCSITLHLFPHMGRGYLRMDWSGACGISLPVNIKDSLEAI